MMFNEEDKNENTSMNWNMIIDEMNHGYFNDPGPWLRIVPTPCPEIFLFTRFIAVLRPMKCRVVAAF